MNRTSVISFLYVFPLYVFSMYFNLTFYTSFNYFYWNFSSNFLIDFPQYEWLFFFFMWGGKIRKHIFDNRLKAPGPTTWMAFLSLYKGRNPKTRFRQISPFRKISTLFDKFRHYSTNLDKFRQLDRFRHHFSYFSIIFDKFRIFRQISPFQQNSTELDKFRHFNRIRHYFSPFRQYFSTKFAS